MNSAQRMRIQAVVLLTALTIPLGLTAQNNHDHHKHHHYKLIDMGTFGGPMSSINFPLWLGTLNNHGVATGWSSTSIPTSSTSNPLVCGGINGAVPFITHTFAWRNGVVSDLGSLGGADYCSEPFWVNHRGDIVGASENGLIDQQFLGFNQMHPVLWRNGEIIDLGTLGGNQGGAWGINNRGQIAGDSTTSIPDPYCFFATVQIRAFLWEKGQMRDLGTLGGNCASPGFVTIDAAVNTLNERGQVVGASTTSTIPNPLTGVPTWAPFLWEDGKGMTNLGTLGGAWGGAQGINNRGQVIGQSSIAADPAACNAFPDNGDLNCHGFLWDKGMLTDLTTSTIGGSFSNPKNINDAGEIVGAGAFPGKPFFQAFLWRKGVATDLGNLGGCNSSAQAINSKTQVVGFAVSCDGVSRQAFLWEHGSIVDLNTLIPPDSGLHLTAAGFLNDRGEIVGDGLLANGDNHAFLLIPCDDKHPGVEGCDYNMVESSVVASVHLTVNAAPSRTLPITPWRRSNPFHFPGPVIPQTN
jgi:probable HAF family extracellular repeat protein